MNRNASESCGYSDSPLQTGTMSGTMDRVCGGWSGLYFVTLIAKQESKLRTNTRTDPSIPGK